MWQTSIVKYPRYKLIFKLILNLISKCLPILFQLTERSYLISRNLSITFMIYAHKKLVFLVIMIKVVKLFSKCAFEPIFLTIKQFCLEFLVYSKIWPPPAANFLGIRQWQEWELADFEKLRDNHKINDKIWNEWQ